MIVKSCMSDLGGRNKKWLVTKRNLVIPMQSGYFGVLALVWDLILSWAGRCSVNY